MSSDTPATGGTTGAPVNTYTQSSFMQGGRPIEVADALVHLGQDGSVTSSIGQTGSWVAEGSEIVLSCDGAPKAERYCHYAESVTTASRDHLFCYGKRLAPQSLGFALPVAAVDDNPTESLKDHLAKTHPGCRRVLSRSSQDFYDLFPKGGSYLEVGVAYGNNALRLSRALQPKELHLVDCWEVLEGSSDAYSQANLDHAYAGTLEKFGDDPVAVFHKGLSQEVLTGMAPGQFDMMYIDADHTEEACYRDLTHCEPLVKPKGFLCGHDYTRHANTADGAVARTNYGVIEAVDRFCRDHGWELVALTIEVSDWCFPSYVLTRKS